MIWKRWSRSDRTTANGADETGVVQADDRAQPLTDPLGTGARMSVRADPETRSAFLESLWRESEAGAVTQAMPRFTCSVFASTPEHLTRATVRSYRSLTCGMISACLPKQRSDRDCLERSPNAWRFSGASISASLIFISC